MEEFDPAKLSLREREILDLAVDGLTDQQIAHRLQISASTVNSYWVRIRGKVGYLSRTELAAKCLRHSAQEELEKLHAECDRYRRQVEELEGEREDARHAECYQSALEAMPEPMFVMNGDGKIVFANLLLAEMFHYDPCGLVGMPVGTLFVVGARGEALKIADHFYQPAPVRMGIDRVIYGRMKDGNRLRVLLLLGSIPSTNGVIATCIVRSFLQEVDMLRRRAAATVENEIPPSPHSGIMTVL